MGKRSVIKKELLKTMALVFLFSALLVIGGIFLLPLKSTGVLLWMLVASSGLFLLVRWHSRGFAYRCMDCGSMFSISLVKELLTPQETGVGGWKYLRCPQCGKKGRARAVSKK